ncbi:MAG: SusD/RagB family nutrient-binding outer membrane lipoprotein [Mucilaginibacter sp.]|uniref:SusD/RagB family nutrient-binding outer membrane lipoprotein n=1 Tax=Mucilaginibacter sp. TaxID=1882438 RepID=UPI003264E56A
MKKLNKYITIAFIAAATLVFPGCKHYYDLDVNPNYVPDPPLSVMLTTATYKAGINSYNVGSAVAPYVQYIANPTASAASDTYQQVDFTGTWDALYFAMADVTDMKTKAIAQNSSEYIGVADVLLSYQLSLVNDLWGAAPFSDAFNPKQLFPKYDSEQTVYATSLSLINEAITQLTKTDAVIKLVGTSDFIHAGSRIAWLKTAYALKARLLNKVSKTATYDPAAVLTALSSSYASNADDAGMASFPLNNPWANVATANAGNSLGGWLSEQLIDAMNGTTYGIVDPRLRKLTDSTVNKVYIGTTNGAGNKGPANNTVKDECYVSISSPWTSKTSPLLLVTYAETKFIEAEANLRINTTASRLTAYTAYLAGINANMDKLQVPPAAIVLATGLPNPRMAYMTNASVGAAALTLDLIFKEKYIATYLNPEAWNDARRYDYKYKDFTLPVNAVLTDFIRRLAYPPAERSKNGANVPPPVPLTDRIFWDK